MTDQDALAAQVEANDALTEDLRALLNGRSRENVSGTPDYVLAAVMMEALRGFEDAVLTRDRWFGFTPTVGDTPAVAPPADPPHRVLL